jgi:F420-dependent oxidoreductase-like protein
MRVGLQMNVFRAEADGLRGWIGDVARAADQGGFYSFWMMDHFFQLGGWLGPAEDRMLEGYSAVSYVAGVTERVRLGLLVTGVIYRYPAVLIKTVTTLDVLSGGRAYFGVGAAWYEHESVSLGLPFPPRKERFELLEDTLRLAHHMWKGDTSPFEGRHVRAPYPVSNPQPVSKPHPPIMIGGMGETKTLRFVAQYGDACNLFAGPGPDVLAHKLDVLKGHCEALGRPYADIEKTALDTIDLSPGQMTSADVIRRLHDLAALGIQHVMLGIKHPYDASTIERIGREIVREVEAL